MRSGWNMISELIMNKLEIIDESKLKTLFKVVKWIDDKRWENYENYNFISVKEDIKLNNSEYILLHWILYIMDRQMPFMKIWDNGGKVFSKIIDDYSTNKERSVENILEDYYKEKNDIKGKYQFIINSDEKFISRFITSDIQNIRKTLTILNEKYERSIVKFIVDVVSRFETNEDLLVRVACALNMLTYRGSNEKNADIAKNDNIKKTIEMLTNDKQFNKELASFKKQTTTNKKRLWCALRDYNKGYFSDVFKNAVEELNVEPERKDELKSKWDSIELYDLELPGDVWNTKDTFVENIMEGKLNIGNDSIPKNWKFPKILRIAYDTLYDTLKENEKRDWEYYPEQFDFTFNFVPRMCDNKECSICLFGKNKKNIESICINNKEKYCTVLLASCGYKVKCDPGSCPIVNEDTIGLCKAPFKRNNV